MTTKTRLMVLAAAVLAAAWLTPTTMATVTAQTRAAAPPQAAASQPAPKSAFKTAYRVSFPAPEHHWMQVEATYSGLGAAPLQARMARSSPGRYAVHEFAKNIFAISGEDGAGKALKFTRPNVDEWDFAGHNGTVKVTYRIFGDHADGTYFGVDTTHAHLNMPASFLWAVGHDNDPIDVTFVPPSGLNWKIATQLYPSASSTFVFTAPNIQYFMDSPTELSNFLMGRFSLPNVGGTSADFRVMVHGDGSQADVDDLTSMIKRLAQEEEAVYGEFPKYEPGYYTFLLDYAPWGFGDGMEHRNSTSISNPGLSIKTAQGRAQAMSTVAHEFFHNWNVERIRPQGLEPFDFTRENITCCLWLAEGFTQYYGPLLLTRAGFGGGRNGGAPVGNIIPVITGSGRTVRSAVEMSQYGPFNDAATSIDMTDGNRTFISYYTYGGAVAAALDLSLRELTNGKTSLDDYMRLLWTRFGKPGGSAPGLVGHPYSLADIRKALADLTNNPKFADDFFDKYIEGREVVDYKRLLALAGYDLRPANPDRGYVGGPVSAGPDGLDVGTGGGRGGRGGGASPVAFNTPLYAAGVDEGDVITTIDGQPATDALWNALPTSKKPGDVVSLGVRRRDGANVTLKLTVTADPSLQISAMDTLSDAQKAFRDAWLSTRVK